MLKADITKKDAIFEIMKEFLRILVLEYDRMDENHCRINQKRIAKIVCCKLSSTHQLIIDDPAVLLHYLLSRYDITQLGKRGRR